MWCHRSSNSGPRTPKAAHQPTVTSMFLHLCEPLCFFSCRGILCIHPSFRIIGLAEPPVVGGSSQQQWLNSELLSMFLFHHVRPLSKQEEAQVIYEMVNKLESLHGAMSWESSRYFATSPLVSPPKWRLRNERRNSILIPCHYPDQSSASDWLRQISAVARPIRSISQIWVVTRHQYGIFAVVSQTSFCGNSGDGIAKCRLSFFRL